MGEPLVALPMIDFYILLQIVISLVIKEFWNVWYLILINTLDIFIMILVFWFISGLIIMVSIYNGYDK